jgi:uncharacterized phage-associated protein
MPYSAVKVANEFLRLAAEADPPRPVTPLQLLKLVYIANGWSLGLKQQALVNESAEAWTYGPVIPELYRQVRQFRASPIQGPLDGDYDRSEISIDDRNLISAVYKAYGHLSGPQLSNMTHLPGSPWSEAWNGGAGQNVIIRSDNIAAHYRQLAERRAS